MDICERGVLDSSRDKSSGKFVRTGNEDDSQDYPEGYLEQQKGVCQTDTGACSSSCLVSDDALSSSRKPIIKNLNNDPDVSVNISRNDLA